MELINMNEEALKDAYNLFVNTGYNKSFDDFKNLISTNPDALKDAYSLFTNTGYQKSIDDFSILMGVKKKDATVISGESTSASTLPQVSSSVSSSSQSTPQSPEMQQFADRFLGQQLQQPQQPQAKSNITGADDITGTTVVNGQKVMTTSQADRAKWSTIPTSSNRPIIDREKPVDIFKSFKEVTQGPIETEQQKAEKMSFVEPLIKSLDSDFIQLDEEAAVPKLRYLFEPLGFKFEESGIGDYVTVTAPDNATKTTIPLDPFFGIGAANSSEQLKNFIRNNTQGIRKETLDEISSKYTNENKKYATEEEYKTDANYLNTEASKIISEEADIKKSYANLEAETNMLNSMPEGQRNTPEYIDKARDLQLKLNALQERVDYVAESRKKLSESPLAKATGQYVYMKAQQGGPLGGLINKFTEGFGRILNDKVGNLVQLVVQSRPTDELFQMINNRKYASEIAQKKGLKPLEEGVGHQKFMEWLNSLPDSDRQDVIDGVQDRIAKGVKYGDEYGEGISNKIRPALTNLIGDKSTTEEYIKDIEQNNFVGGAVLGAAGSIPAMLGPAPLRVFSMMAQSSDYLDEEMQNNPNFENISEGDKNILKTLVGVPVAILEEYGLRNMIASKGYLNNLLFRFIEGKTASQITSKSFAEFVRNDVKNGLARAGLTALGATLAEAETGAMQQAVEIAIKDAYNKNKLLFLDNPENKKMFDSPDFLSPETIITGDAMYEILKGGAQEAIGGFVLGMPNSVAAGMRGRGFTGMSDTQFEAFESMANDDNIQSAWISTLKARVANGDITAAEARNQLNDYRNAVGLYRSLPDNLTIGQKKEAMNLIRERNAIKQSIQDKDPQLTIKQQDRINQINEQLKNLPENAIQEPSTEEGVLRPEQPQVELPKVGEGNAQEQAPAQVTQQEQFNEQDQERLKTLSERLKAAREVATNSIVIDDKEISIDDAEQELKALFEKQLRAEMGATTLATSATTTPTSPTATPVTEITAPAIETPTNENKNLLNNRNTDLFPGETDFANSIGNSGSNSNLDSYNEVNGVGVATYTNPNNGMVDVIMSATSDNDYVGYVRIYENGKPTNRFTSKMSNESGNKSNFKIMIKEAQSRLPKGHEYTESTSISLDGVRVFADQLNRGYEILTDESGNPITRNVTLNRASVEGLRSETNQEQKEKLYEDLEVESREEFEKIKDKILKIMPQAKVFLNKSNNKVLISLPILVSTATTTQTTPATETTTQAAPNVVVASNTEGVNTIIQREQRVANTSSDANVRNTASTKAKVLSSALNALKTLRSILPDIDIHIHENENTYNELMPTLKGVKGSAGNFSVTAYQDGRRVARIDINLSKANARTVIHEASHAILFKAFGDNPSLFKSFKNKLASAVSKSDNARLNKFISQYTNVDIRPEEYLVELSAILSTEGKRLSPTVIQRIAKLINDIVGKFTNGKLVPFRGTTTALEMQEFMNSMSNALRSGKTISLQGAIGDVDLDGVTEKINSKAKSTGRIIDTSSIMSKSTLIENLGLKRPSDIFKRIKFGVKLSDIGDVISHLTFSDRLVTGIVGDKLFLGGILFASATNRVWASSTKDRVNRIIKSMPLNKDGYRYLMPAISSETTHMSNKDMTNTALGLVEKSISNGSISPSDANERIIKALNKSDIKPDFLEIYKSKIVGKGLTPSLVREAIDEAMVKSKSTFEERLSFVESLLGKADKNKTKRFGDLPSFGELANGLAEPITNGHKFGDILLTIRTKGELEAVEPKPGDDDYHPSYPWVIRAVKSDGSIADVETLIFDKSYNAVYVFPKVTNKQGDVVTFEDYKTKYGDKAVSRYLNYIGGGPMSTVVSEKIMTTASELNDISKIESATPLVTSKSSLNPALRDVESTAKALEGKEKNVKGIKKIFNTVYHATKGKFKDFSENFLGSNTKAKSAQEGFFFASNKNVAISYASKANDVYERLQKEMEESQKLMQEKVGMSLFDYNGTISQKYKFTPEEQAKIEANKNIIEKAQKSFDAFYEYELSFEYEPTWTPNELSGKGELKEVVLNIKNPFIYDQKGKPFRDKTFVDIIKEAKDKGHDGVIIKNTYDGNNPFTREMLTDVHIVFKPSQIKDANQAISEAYHKAKADGSNPELVKAVEDLLSPQVTSKSSLTEGGMSDENINNIISRARDTGLSYDSIRDILVNLNIPVEAITRAIKNNIQAPSIKEVEAEMDMASIQQEIDMLEIKLDLIRTNQDPWAIIERMLMRTKFNPDAIKRELGALRTGRKQDINPAKTNKNSNVTIENFVEGVIDYFKNSVSIDQEGTMFGITDADKNAIMQMTIDYLQEFGRHETFEASIKREIYALNQEINRIDKSIKKNNPNFNWKAHIRRLSVLKNRDDIINEMMRLPNVNRQDAELLADQYLYAYDTTGEINKAKQINAAETAPRKTKIKLSPETISKVVEKARKEGVSDINIRNLLKKYGVTDKQIGQYLGSVSKEKTEVTVNEYDALIEQIKLEARAAKEGKKSVSDAIKAITEYFNKMKDRGNLTRSDLTKIINIISKVKDQKTLDAAAEKIYQIVQNATTDIVEVSDKKMMVEQIRKMARAAREAKMDINSIRANIAKVINAMEAKGTITARQAQVIINKFGKLNLDSIKQVENFFQYMEKVFADAEYDTKIRQARKNISALKKLAKNKKTAINLISLAREFLRVDPSLVEDIDKYNAIASSIIESLEGSKIVKEELDVKIAGIVSQVNVMDYVWREVALQEELQREIADKIAQEQFGVEEGDLTYEQIVELLDSDTEDSANKINNYSGVIRSKLQSMFSGLSSIVKSMIEQKEDPFTYEPTKFTDEQIKTITDFMSMDITKLSIKDALRAVDAIHNFIVNRSTASMGAIFLEYKGRNNLNQLVNENVKTRDLKLFWDKSAGRLWTEATGQISIIFERLFKSSNIGRRVQKMSGLTDVINGFASAETTTNNIVKTYTDRFYKLKANGQEFNTAFNDAERGMAAFMSRTVYGTKAMVQKVFDARKKIIEDSIKNLKNGTEAERRISDVYEEVYNKILKDSNTSDEVRGKSDPVNLEAVNYWVSEWDSKFDAFADVCESVYNSILEKFANFTPDRYSNLVSTESDSTTKEQDILNSAFIARNGGSVIKKSKSLMEAKKLPSLPKGKYVNLSFDTVNATAMKDSLSDINTAAPIRQVLAFINSEELQKLIPSADDRQLFINRIKTYLQTEKKAIYADNSEVGKAARKFIKVLNFGSSLVLSSLRQAPQQVIPIMIDTLFNTGKINFYDYFNETKYNLMKNSGHSIANRLNMSAQDVKNINGLLDYAAKNPGEKAFDAIAKVNDIYLKLFLAKPDAFVAQASWIMYYERSLKKQGIPAKDYYKGPMNEEAADYATWNVDRNQNPSNEAQKGSIFTEKDPRLSAIYKVLFTLASFRMNTTNRIHSDIISLTSKTTTMEDRRTHAASLAGAVSQAVIFIALSSYVSYMLKLAFRKLMGRDDDEEEKDKILEKTLKGSMTRLSSDLLSPAPLLDPYIIWGINYFDEKYKLIKGVAQEDIESPLYDFENNNSFGIAGAIKKRADQFREAKEMVLTGQYVDKYNKVHTITEEDREFLKKFVLVPGLINIVGLLPGESDMFVRTAIETAESGKSTQKKDKAAAKKSAKESLMQGYETRAQMKRYDPQLYEETFGKLSPNYDQMEELKALKKEQREEAQRIEDEARGYVPPPKKRDTNRGRWSSGRTNVKEGRSWRTNRE